MLNTPQKLGGLASILAGLSFVFGFALLLTTLAELYDGSLNTVETVAFMDEHQAVYYLWHIVIYVVFGVLLAVAALALHHRLSEHHPFAMQLATTFGMIWVGLVIASGMIFNVGAAAAIDLYDTDPQQAATAWQAIDAVAVGIGGGVEVVGGLWVALLSWVAWQTGALPRALNGLGLAAGTAGIISTVPPLADVGAIFGVGMIIWFIWVGVVMMRSTPETVAPRQTPALVADRPSMA